MTKLQAYWMITLAILISNLIIGYLLVNTVRYFSETPIIYK